MSIAVTADAFSVPEETAPAPAAKKGFLSRMFNAAVKAAPTAAVSMGLGFALRTAALTTTAAAGASTGVTLAAIATASGTTAAAVAFGKEWWAARKDEEARKNLFTKATAKKVGSAFALASGFGALGGLIAPAVIDYVKHIDFAAAGEKVANFFLPTAGAYDYNYGDDMYRKVYGDVPPTVKPAVVSAPPAAAPSASAAAPAVSEPTPAAPKGPVFAASEPQQAPAAPRNVPPASTPKPAAPVSADPAPSKPQGAPPQTPPANPGKSAPLERVRTMLAQPGAKAPQGLGNLDRMSSQQLKDAGVRALWRDKNPALARALFEASGNNQARQALAFMDKTGMGLPKGGAVAAATAQAAAAPAAPAKIAPELVEKGPGLKARIAAVCQVLREPMNGLQLGCTTRNPTMYPGDRVDVTDSRGKLTQVFYQGASKLRTLAEAISTKSFLTDRVAPVILNSDEGMQKYLARLPAKPETAITLAAH